MNTPQQDRAIVLSKNPNAAMQEMMNTIDSLRGVITRETEALEGTNTRAFLEIQDEKLKIARQYQDGIEQMLERREEMKGTNPLLRRRLEDLHNSFAEISARNIEALKRMQRVSASLGNTIRRSARDAALKQRAFSYGETGALKSSEKKSVSMGLSETA